MKIIIFSKPFWPSVGGVESTTRMLALSLIKMGHEVHVYTEEPIECSLELDEGYTIHRSTSFWTLVKISLNAHVLISKGGISVRAGLAAILSRCILIVWHEMFGAYFHEVVKLSDRPLNFLRFILFKYARLHVGVTRACLDSKGSIPASKGCVVYNPVSEELTQFSGQYNFRESQFKKTVDLVFVGRILRSKGIFVLAEALENISEMGIKLKVVIVGDGVDLASLRAHLDPLDSIDVSYAGVQIGKGLASILAQSRILVFPSTTHPEGMGLVAAEAMMFAVPVIGADQPAIREVVGDAGIMTRLGDSFSLSTAVTNVLSNEALQKRLSISALERSKSFLLPEFNEKLASIFTKIDSQ